MSKPIVSVIVDTYNHERFIAQAIESVLEQGLTPGEMEIIVVDDGSTDNTGAVARKFAPRIRYLYKPNGGQASAFNAAIPEARGEVVAFLDGDDWWARNKLSTVLTVLESNPEVGAVGHGLHEVYSDDRPHGLVTPEKVFRLHLRDSETALLFSRLRGFLGTSRMAIRGKLLDRILPIPGELVIEADEYIFTLAPALADAIVLDQPLCFYRLHAGNLFQYAVNDPGKSRRKQRALATLVQRLPPRLTALGVSREIVKTVIEPLWVDAERMRLGLDGGWPWETFYVERLAYRLGYRRVELAYRIYKAFVLGMTLTLPPTLFYRLRQWYAAKGLRHWRRWTGEPLSAEPVVEMRPLGSRHDLPGH